MNPNIKHIVTSVGAASGVFTLGRAMTRSSLRIFTYHGVERCDDPIVNFDRLQVDPALFEQQIAWIASRYHPMSGSDLVSIVASGTSWPARAALITLDDGYANNLAMAAPILRRHGVPAVVFVTTGFVEGTDYPWWYALREEGKGAGVQGDRVADVMRLERELVGKPRKEQELAVATLSADRREPFPFMTPDQLHQLASFDIQIGLHGHAHLACGVEDLALIRSDLDTCRKKLEGWGISPLPLFAYPYGSIPANPGPLHADLRDRGVRVAMTTRMGLNQPGCAPLSLKRFDVNGGRTVANLAAISSGLLG